MIVLRGDEVSKVMKRGKRQRYEKVRMKREREVVISIHYVEANFCYILVVSVLCNVSMYI